MAMPDEPKMPQSLPDATGDAMRKAADLLDKSTVNNIGRRQGVEGIVTYLLMVLVLLILLALVAIIFTLILVNSAQSRELNEQTAALEVSNRHLATIESTIRADIVSGFGKRFAAMEERDHQQLDKMAAGIGSASKERADLKLTLERIERLVNEGRR
jgi:hypothetical protein